MKHENDGITYLPVKGRYKCKNCGKRYNNKEEECDA